MMQYPDGIHAIDTEYVRPKLDASHLIVEDGRAAFVDTGTNYSVPLLLDALASTGLDVGDVDYVILTHIHLDHAGGAGRLMQELPNARCAVHPRGARHIANPEKLIAGTEAVYGVEMTRRMYGEIQPIDEDRLLVPDDGQVIELNGRPLRIFYTLGHAKHHYCIHDARSNGVFTGDSFGISYREFDTGKGAFIYPTTTPIHFDPPEAHKAIDRIMGFGPEQVFLTHYSRVDDLDRLAADLHTVIDGFVAIAKQHANDSQRTESIKSATFDYLAARLDRHGFAGGRDAMYEILEPDLVLNTQGLEFWLDHAEH